MGAGQMGIEGRPIIVEFIKKDRIRGGRITTDIELPAPWFFGKRCPCIFLHERHEIDHATLGDGETYRDSVHQKRAPRWSAGAAGALLTPHTSVPATARFVIPAHSSHSIAWIFRYRVYTLMYALSMPTSVFAKAAKESPAMSNAEKLRVACVGAGYFSQFHIGSWARLDRVDLVGVCDRNIGRARETGLPAFDDLSAMLTATRPDLLDIILPPHAQAEAIRTALAAGIHEMICQKPFCTDLAEACALTAEAEAAGVRIIIHENFRFQPWYRRIKSALDDGAVGPVQQVTFRLRPGDGQGPRAYLDRQPYFQTMERFLIHETGVHWIDTFRYFLGDPVSVYAELRRINPAIAGEDAGLVLFEHPGGVRALFDGNRTLDHPADNLRRTMGEALIEGSDGTIRLSGDGAVHLRRFGALEETDLLLPDAWDGFGGDCVHKLQSHVVAGLLDGCPLENLAQDYLTVVRIEEAIYLSARTGRKIPLDAA